MEGFSIAHVGEQAKLWRDVVLHTLLVPSWRAGKLWMDLVLHILLVPSWRVGQALEGFSIAHIVGSSMASRPSFQGFCWFQVGISEGLYKTVDKQLVNHKR